MQQQQLVAFFLFAVVAAVTPGPSNILVMTAAARSGLAGGLRCLAGVVAGMALLMATAVLGLGAFLQATPAALPVLKAAGAVFLLWLAWKIAAAPPPALQDGAAPVGFRSALLFQWINPKSWVVCASAASTYAGTGMPPLLQAAVLGGIFALAAAPSCAVWLLGGAALKRWLRAPRAARAFNVAMGLLLAASVVLIVR